MHTVHSPAHLHRPTWSQAAVSMALSSWDMEMEGRAAVLLAHGQ